MAQNRSIAATIKTCYESPLKRGIEDLVKGCPIRAQPQSRTTPRLDAPWMEACPNSVTLLPRGALPLVSVDLLR